MSDVAVRTEEVERTIEAFTRLDERGDKKAMNKLAQRLQREQPFLLQHAAGLREGHGDAVGEAAVFYVTLVWAMFDRGSGATLPRLTQDNLDEADKIVAEALAADPGLAERPVHERVAPALAERQPHLYGKVQELIAEDVKEDAMAEATAALIWTPIQVAIEAFDAALEGRRPGERQGTIVHDEPKVGRNEPCPCGSGKKYKKCHGAPS
jgi:SEC-C motif